MGKPIPVTYGEWRPGDQPVYISDISKARKELGWSPKVSVDEGIERMYAWIRDNQRSLHICSAAMNVVWRIAESFLPRD